MGIFEIYINSEIQNFNHQSTWFLLRRCISKCKEKVMFFNRFVTSQRVIIIRG